jgi:NAD kinase
MSFHMGSLGFLTPFQFYASDSTDTKFSTDSENGTGMQVASRVPAYRGAVEKVLQGKGAN